MTGRASAAAKRSRTRPGGRSIRRFYTHRATVFQGRPAASNRRASASASTAWTSRSCSAPEVCSGCLLDPAPPRRAARAGPFGPPPRPLGIRKSITCAITRSCNHRECRPLHVVLVAGSRDHTLLQRHSSCNLIANRRERDMAEQQDLVPTSVEHRRCRPGTACPNSKQRRELRRRRRADGSFRDLPDSPDPEPDPSPQEHDDDAR